MKKFNIDLVQLFHLKKSLEQYFFDSNATIKYGEDLVRLDNSVKAIVLPAPINPSTLGSEFVIVLSDKIVRVPCVQIVNRNDEMMLRNWMINDSSLEVIIDSDGDNLWSDIFQSYPMFIFQGLFIALDLLIAGTSGYKIYLFLKAGCVVNIGLICMFLNIASAITRIISLIDPLGIFGITNNYRFTVCLLNYPFTLGSALVISFYWIEILYFFDSKMRSFIYVLRIPFIITTTILILAEIIINIINIALVYNRSVDQAQAILAYFYAIVGVIVSIFYFMISVQLVRKSYQLSKNRKRQKYYQRLRNKVFANAFCLLVFSLVPLFFQVSLANPYLFFITFIFFYGSSTSVNLCEMLIFDPEKVKLSKGSSKNKRVPNSIPISMQTN